MEHRINYKGYVIEVRPDQLANGGWQVNVLIERHFEADVRVRSAHASNTFSTEDEAIERSLDFGKQIIDGAYPHISVTDL